MAKQKVKKTNAVRALEQKKIDHTIYEYDSSDGQIDGISVANKIGKEPERVFKTLVAHGNSKEIYVFIIPVEAELDLKKAAKVASEKKIELIAVKDIIKLTGYIRGGCSPIGMKKSYKTFLDEHASQFERIIFSGGKIGMQIEANPQELLNVINGQYGEIAK